MDDELKALFRAYTLPVSNAEGFRCLTFAQFKKLITDARSEGYSSCLKDNNALTNKVFSLS